MLDVNNLPRMTNEQRIAVRGLLRAEQDWKAYRASHGIKPDSITKEQLGAAIAHYGIEWQVERILAMAPGPVGVIAEAIVAQEASEGETVTEIEIETEESTVPAGVESEVDSVLAPMRPFLAPGLLSQIESAIRPIVVRANKPAEIVTVTREVPIHVSPMRPGEARRAARASVSTMSKVFGTSGPRGKGKVTLWDDPQSPAIDPDYVVDGDLLHLIASAAEHGEISWLAGAAGTGKTSAANQFAALTGRGFLRIGFHGQIEIVDWTGQKEPMPKDGGAAMEWVDGAFLQAVRRPGTVILLDELTAAAPGTQTYLQTTIDTRTVTLPTGEVVPFADGVVIVIADNTSGYGDESGVYAGTHAANAALVDRAARTIIVDYLAPHLEAEALVKRTGIPQPAALRLAKFARQVRVDAAQNGGDARPFSFRRLAAFANATHRDGISVTQAWTITAYSRLPEADRETLRTMVRTQFKAAHYELELQGKPAPADDAVPQDVATTVAAGVFSDTP